MGEEEKNQGIKVYGMCIPPIISCHLCTHFLYKDTTTTFQGKRDKKKGKRKKEKLGEEERKKMHWGWWVPTTFVSLCVGLETWRMAWTKSLLLFLFTSLMGLPLYRLPEIDDSSSSLSFKSQQYFSLFFSWYFLPVYSMCSSVSRIIQCTCRFDWKRIFNFD